MGLPPPGVEIKLVPAQDKLRGAAQGPEHHAGLLAPARADRAGVRRGGLVPPRRLVRFRRREEPEAGLLFRGRIAEDFKLATGTWVQRRAAARALHRALRAVVRDVVIAGEGRNELGALVFPAGRVSRGANFREKLQEPSTSTGSSNRIARAMLLEEPPVARRRRGDRQGHDQPEGGAAQAAPQNSWMSSRMDLEKLVAIDVHTHAWKSALAVDDKPTESQEAMGRYFRYQPQHATVPEMADYYRKLKMAFVVFTVDSPQGAAQDHQRGDRRARAQEHRRRDPVREHQPAPRQGRRASWRGG